MTRLYNAFFYLFIFFFIQNTILELDLSIFFMSWHYAWRHHVHKWLSVLRLSPIAPISIIAVSSHQNNGSFVWLNEAWSPQNDRPLVS